LPEFCQNVSARCGLGKCGNCNHFLKWCALLNTAQDTLSPKLIATEAFTDATAAVGRLHDIYGRNTGFLRHHLEAYV